MKLYLEYRGGLGDIFYQIFRDGGYNLLSNLAAGDRASIVLITHNPYVRELFDYHPCTGQMDICVPGYWPPNEDEAARRCLGLSTAPYRPPPADGRIPKFYPAADDNVWLDWLEGKSYVLFSATAGLPERDIPRDLLRRLVEMAASYSFLPVFVGRNYDRSGRQEQRPVGALAVDLIDKLSVPGVVVAARKAMALVCCHSALNILAWLLRKPQLLLYPQSVYHGHIARRDQWAFGIDFPECRDALFDDAGALLIADQFFRNLHQDKQENMRPTVSKNESAQTGFEDFANKLLAEAIPLGQNSGPQNLGFGWIYYGLVRNLRPDFVVVIGSCAGFTPFCAARALRDNGWGKVVLIDPSYSGEGNPGWGGRDNWRDNSAVEAQVADFGLSGWFEHIKMTSADAFPLVKQITASGEIGIVIIDGSHTYEDSLRDFDLYSSLVSEGYVLLHDSVSGTCDVWKTIATLRSRGYPLVTISRDVGLSLVEVRRPRSVRGTWDYLCNESNRGELLLPYAERIVSPGDRVMDIYCGFSPLTPLLSNVQVTGYDADAAIIDELRKRAPQHRWEQVSEREMLFAADLPDQIDVLIGLGLSRGHAPWDPQFALDCVRYLLGRYYPGGCPFETAADYYDAGILADLRNTLLKLHYSFVEETIQTNMPSYGRRQVLVAERSLSEP